MAIIDVIRNDGKRGYMMWKYPSDELANWSQLIVREGEEAVLFVSGRPTDRFAAGRYTLNTANLPLLGNLMRIPFGGKSPFTAELWYVNVGETLDIKWGTDTPILLSGSNEQLRVSMRGYGLIGVRIIDAGLFLLSMRSSIDSFDKGALAAYLRCPITEVVRCSIAACFEKFGNNFFERSDASKLLAGQLIQAAEPITAQYGIVPSCLIISDLCMVAQEDGSEKHLTFSVMSVVIPPAVPQPPTVRPVTMPHRKPPIVVASFIILLLLILIFCVLLPPRQTADFVGIAFVSAAHFLVAATAVWLFTAHRGLMVTLGFSATAVLYWLGSMGTALLFRLFSIVDTGLLVALELGMAGVAALALMGFWYSRGYDAAQHGEETVEDEEQI